MTDKERIEKTYEKIKKKYPNVTSKDEIDALAIKHDKRNTLLTCAGLFAGAILCGVLFWLIRDNETFTDTRSLLLIASATAIFEFFRNLIFNYPKIEKRYKPVLKVKYEGELTKELILKDGKKLLKDSTATFSILKTALFDKEDELDTGVSNNVYHYYYLYFMLPGKAVKSRFKVSKETYVDAVIGSDYYVVLTSDNSIAAAYQAVNYTLAPELSQYCDGSVTASAEKLPPLTVENAASSNDTLYKPNSFTTENVVPVKTKKVLPILALVFTAISMITPGVFSLILDIAAVVMGIIAVAQQRSKLSITSLIVSIVILILLILGMIFIITGYVSV